MGNIRPFQLPQDLETMFSLVEDGFQYPENPSWSIQADERESMLDTYHGARRIWPLIRVLQVFVPLLKDILCGFIYEVEGKPVGLINFFRPRNVPEWQIGNVTVLPEYRRRGIARELVAATLDELRLRKAAIARLEVIDANFPAYALYQEMGFNAYSRSSQYDFEGNATVEVLPLPPGYVIQPIGRTEWRVRLALMKRMTPPEIVQYEPVEPENFRPPASGYILGPLFEAVSGSRQESFGMFSASGEIVAAAIYRYRGRPGGVNSAELHLDPAYSELANGAVSHLLSSIQKASPGRRIELDLKNWQPALSQAAEKLGCTKRYTFRQMAIRLG